MRSVSLVPKIIIFPHFYVLSSVLFLVPFPIRSKQYVDALWTFPSSQTLCWLSTTALTLSYILAIGAFLWDIVSRGCSSSREFTPLGILIGVKSWVEQYSYVPRDFSSTKMFHSY